MRYLPLVLLLLAGFSVCHAEEVRYVIRKVQDGHTLLTQAEGSIHLAGIYTPSLHHDGKGRDEPLGREAQQALEKLIAGRPVTLSGEARDRYARLSGQAYAEDTWLQGELVRQGLAMLYGEADLQGEIAGHLRELEREARTARRGIWAEPYFRVLTPEEAESHLDRYKLVRGKVVSVHAYHGGFYINFFADWHGRFALYVPQKSAVDMPSLPQLEGKTILARGWIHYRRAALMTITRPDMIEPEP